MKLHSLKDLFVDQVKDLYNAEHQLIKALPKMAKTCSSPRLQHAIEDHLEQTKGQAVRLEKIFDRLSLPHKGKKCKAMEGLIEEGKEVMDMDAEPALLDAALIAAAQRVEHYEIAGYGCAKTFATLLGDKESVELLQQTLDEEKLADEKLTELAMEEVNQEAQSAQSGTGDTQEEVAMHGS